MISEYQRIARLNNWIPMSEVLEQAGPLLDVLRKVFPDFDRTYHEVAEGAMTFVNTVTGDISHAGDWQELIESDFAGGYSSQCYAIPFGDIAHQDMLKLVRWEGSKIVAEPIIALDYYGEKKPMFQLLIYNPSCDLDEDPDEEDEPQVCVRFDDRGKIVEVQVVPEVKVHPHYSTDPSPWQIERDGQ